MSHATPLVGGEDRESLPKAHRDKDNVEKHRESVTGSATSSSVVGSTDPDLEDLLSERNPQPGNSHYCSDQNVHWVTAVIASVFMARMFVGAIIALDLAKAGGLRLRMALVALFTTVFAAGGRLLSLARVTDVYMGITLYV